MYFGASESYKERNLPLAEKQQRLEQTITNHNLKTIEYYIRNGEMSTRQPKDKVKKYALSAWLKYKENMPEMGIWEKLKSWVQDLLKPN